MNIEKARLYTIGRLIGIYREQRRGKTQNSFTQRAFAKDICSVNTLKRLESGEVPRDEEVYIILLDKLGLKFGYYELVDNALIELMESLYEAIEYYRLDEIICLCERALSLLEKVKEYIYYNELFTLFEATYKYYKDDIEISVSMMKHFNEIYLYMDELYESLYKRMIFSKMQIMVMNDKEKYFDIIEKLNLKEEVYPSLRLNMVHYYILKSQYITAINLINDFEVLFKQKENYVRLLDVYLYATIVYSEVEDSLSEIYLDKINCLIKNYNFPNIKIMELYASIAYSFYNQGNYDKALKYFNKMVKNINEIHDLAHIIYMADCQRHLGINISIPKLEDKVLNKYPSVFQKMYKYYCHYSKVPSLLKQNMIVKEIAPYLVDNDFIEVFRFEMRCLVEESLNYKGLLLFDKIIDENLSLS